MDVTYYQGETIGFYVEGDMIINLDDNTFKLLFYTKNMTPIVISKSELTSIDTNKYYGEIANTVTKSLPIGQYVQEILYGSTDTTILKEDCFDLLSSQSKKEIA